MVSQVIKQALLAMLLLIGCGQLMAQDLSAFVDRSEITANDVINLTVRVGSQLGDAKPTFTSLERDFIPLRTEVVNNFATINGNVQSWTDYRISLRAKSSGTFTIPAFRVGGQATSPITIHVGEAPQTLSGSGADFFLETTISKSESYVQEQLIYTIKLYYSTGFDQGAQLTTPQVENSVVQQLGSDVSYQEVVDNTRYNVTERKFVIFPQGSGEFTIAPVYFTATVGRGFNSLLNRNRTVREINIGSQAHGIKVLPRPAAFPAGAAWLPASSLSIQEEWSGEPARMEVGEALTRNVTINAEGLSSSILPGLSYSDLPGLKFYPDQPVREDSTDSSGIKASRSEAVAIVASEAGEFSLPEVSIPWWNTRTDTLEYAVIPARILSVMSPVSGAAPQQPQQTGFTPSGNQFIPGGSGDMSQGQRLAPMSLGWIAATVFFALAWLTSTVLWLRARGDTIPVMGRLQGRHQQQAEDKPLPGLDTAWKAFQDACQQQEPVLMRRALIQWGQAYWQDGGLRTLGQISNRLDDPQLHDLLRSLESSLYGKNNGGEFDPVVLRNAMLSHHKRGRPRESREARYQLAPLYKT